MKEQTKLLSFFVNFKLINGRRRRPRSQSRECLIHYYLGVYLCWITCVQL